MDMEETKRIFIEESRELLQDMEQALLDLENNPGDPELINRIFRAAHTIKGNSGMFGFDPIVAFTHVLETLLDQVRKGEISLSETLVTLLFRSRDHLEAMVEGVASDALVSESEETLELKSLLEICGPGGAAPSFEGCVHAPQSCVGCTHRKEQAFHISVRFNRETFRHGQDPRTFLRSLEEMGTLCSAFCVLESVPPVLDPAFDPENCYLGFELELVTSADKKAIQEVFEFAHEDTVLYILPPETKTSEYIAMLQRLPEDDAVIGEYLIQSGAVTRTELTEALDKQKSGGGYLGEILVKSGAVRQEVVTAALDKQKQVRTQKVRETLSIRVDASKLELLINQVGELVISGANVSQLCRASGREDLSESASELFLLVEALRETALSLRMVPIGETFNRFQRVVRDISKEVGKEVSLVVSGGETELDKMVVEKITDPLVHLVRNAVDHGIETPEVRVQRWKPAQGALRLHAYHDAGTIVIQVSDDGGGLNRDRILQKARERGLISPQQTLTDGEILQFVFHPGFSTAEKISNLSG
ncbi:MAG: chemotaxis protein CheA, partial [Nitrospirae bacterium]|nr:chemotaxis protein CheA [Nitrospirota bacterium]